MYEELHGRLQRRGLAKLADTIIQFTAPSIRLTCHRTEGAFLPIGSSKLGGLPDLPPELPWPT
ncbi:MAG TPA: hypothetical protein VF099_03940, partial [Ktedonobacterales bacterium]